MEREQKDQEDMAPEWLVTLLVCPLDKGSLRLEAQGLVCTQCGRCYPIRDGIPMMIPTDMESER
jgi:uncharacterized protein YbaR (Trm112 family)